MKKLSILLSFRSGLQLSRTQNQNGSFEYKVIKISDFTPSGTLNFENEEKITLTHPISENHLTQEGDALVRLKAPLSAVYIDKKALELYFLLFRIKKSHPCKRRFTQKSHCAMRDLNNF